MQRGSGAWRLAHWGSPCTVSLETVTIGGARIAVNRDAAPLFRELGKVFDRHRYVVKPGQSGAYNCRRIAGSDTWSSHAWALAVDVNWNDNPMRSPLTTDIPAAIVREAEAITVGGVQAFRWGGHWSTPDPMHFEVIATRLELGLGDIATGDIEDSDSSLNWIQRRMVQGMELIGVSPMNDNPLTRGLGAVGAAAQWITDPENWRRVAYIALGVLLLLMGSLALIASQMGGAGGAAQTVAQVTPAGRATRAVR